MPPEGENIPWALVYRTRWASSVAAIPTELLAAREPTGVRGEGGKGSIDFAHQCFQLSRVLRTRIIHVNFFFQRLVLVIPSLGKLMRNIFQPCAERCKTLASR